MPQFFDNVLQKTLCRCIVLLYDINTYNLLLFGKYTCQYSDKSLQFDLQRFTGCILYYRSLWLILSLECIRNTFAGKVADCQ